MLVIDQISNSGLFAQSAYSAAVATNDDLGRKISTTYLTAVDLTPYQTIEGMTAYQPAGSYATTNELEQVSADITATIPSTAGLASESYVQTNSAVLTGMIDGKQDTLTFGYDEQDRINSINSSALAGGGDVPEDVMVESAVEYNAVNEISGYNGSAIAQYGAEKQWLVHDDTLVHAANSAQYALGCNISALQRLMGIDETVLWENDSLNVNNGYKTSITISEPYSAFKNLRFEFGDIYGNGATYYTLNFNCDYALSGGGVSSRVLLQAPFGYPPSSYLMRSTQYRFVDYTTMTAECNANFSFRTTWTACSLSVGDGTTGQAGKGIKIFKVIGIGRRNNT